MRYQQGIYPNQIANGAISMQINGRNCIQRLEVLPPDASVFPSLL